MDVDLRERNFDILLLEQDKKVAVELPLGGEDIAFLDVGVELQVDAAVGEFLDAHVHRHGKIEILMGRVHLRQAFTQDCFQIFDIGIVGNPDNGQRPGIVAGAVLEVADIGVVDDLEVAAGVFDDGRAHADAADGAAEIIENDDIPDFILAFKDDEEAGDDILDQALGAKAEDQTEQSDAGKHGGCIDAENAQGPDKGGDDEDVLHQAQQQCRECS